MPGVRVRVGYHAKQQFCRPGPSFSTQSEAESTRENATCKNHPSLGRLFDKCFSHCSTCSLFPYRSLRPESSKGLDSRRLLWQHHWALPCNSGRNAGNSACDVHIDLTSRCIPCWYSPLPCKSCSRCKALSEPQLAHHSSLPCIDHKSVPGWCLGTGVYGILWVIYVLLSVMLCSMHVSTQT